MHSDSEISAKLMSCMLKTLLIHLVILFFFSFTFVELYIYNCNRKHFTYMYRKVKAQRLTQRHVISMNLQRFLTLRVNMLCKLSICKAFKYSSMHFTLPISCLTGKNKTIFRY